MRGGAGERTDGPPTEVNIIVLEELRSGVGRPGFGFCLSVPLSPCPKLCEPRLPHLDNGGHSDRYRWCSPDVAPAELRSPVLVES